MLSQRAPIWGFNAFARLYSECLTSLATRSAPAVAGRSQNRVGHSQQKSSASHRHRGICLTPFFLEGSLKLGYRKELDAIEDEDERRKVYEEMVARAYDEGKAVNSANMFDIDDTIDPAGSRWWVSSLLASVRQTPRTTKKRFIDAW